MCGAGPYEPAGQDNAYVSGGTMCMCVGQNLSLSSKLFIGLFVIHTHGQNRVCVGLDHVYVCGSRVYRIATKSSQP